MPVLKVIAKRKFATFYRVIALLRHYEEQSDAVTSANGGKDRKTFYFCFVLRACARDCHTTLPLRSQ